jgi:hypothetical protein
MDSGLRPLLSGDLHQHCGFLRLSFPRRRESSKNSRKATNLELDARLRGHDDSKKSSPQLLS